MAKIKFGKDDSYDNVKKTLQEALKENNTITVEGLKYPQVLRAHDDWVKENDLETDLWN
jgi:hypothetical protein